MVVKRTDRISSLFGLEKLSPIGCAIQVVDLYLAIALTKKSLQELCNFVSLKGLKKCRNKNEKNMNRRIIYVLFSGEVFKLRGKFDEKEKKMFEILVVQNSVMSQGVGTQDPRNSRLNLKLE